MGDTPQSTAGADTAAIRARCDAATPGFWEAHGSEIWTYPEGGGPPTSCVAFLHPCDGEPERYHLPDAEFIAHARTDLPAVLDLCERQERELERASRDAVAALAERDRWIEGDRREIERLTAERDALAAALAKVTHDFVPSDDDPDICVEYIDCDVEYIDCDARADHPVHQRPDAVLAALSGGDTTPADSGADTSGSDRD